jgi:hypothetical protein
MVVLELLVKEMMVALEVEPPMVQSIWVVVEVAPAL